ncbi:V-type ATP synthase subunit I domain-containing protein [Tepidimicrobium xylanilyticum]|uniref:Uncharacterized protein n=1 Tax=Tepidimicrobium xylanilyticum TaxID=1123352 RepID=A0A1H2V3T3_9FIRM|nr:hypothetical protein [Tepidimicrobium xylanilyticum]GMG96738.1 hypothetical protein EN5CB1_15640 [Tepidimicrobium xylanilyticum]SDW63002.1 hypothetical protein SAMN05660923_01009 [Tepidimicrobium xylanilyticum]
MAFKKIDLDEKIILKNKIPLLIEDETWVKLFGDVNNKDIQYAEEELKELVERKRELERRQKTLQKDKTMAMKMILGISNAVNNENKVHTVGLLDEYKEKIEGINEELDDITYQLETLPQEIRELNFQLLEATVYYGYKELKTRESKLKEIVDELERLRKRIKVLINEKYDYEEWINLTYSFLHGLLGREETEKLDERILE